MEDYIEKLFKQYPFIYKICELPKKSPLNKF